MSQEEQNVNFSYEDLEPNPGVPVAESAPVEAPPVSKEEFSDFKSEVAQGFVAVADAIADLKNSVVPAAIPAKTVEPEGAMDEQTPMPLSWRKAVNEILGEDFDCELSQPDQGGTKFTIIVPREKSNAPSIHWQNFKQDRRTREVGATGLQGVKEWCLKVRANLQATGVKLVQYP